MNLTAAPAICAQSLRRRPCGFSLIELLVAMTVLAALAAISFRGLSSILEAEARVQSETRRWNDVAAVMAHMSRDFSQAAARPARNAAGELVAAMILGKPRAGSADELVITRLGDGEGALALSDPRRVGYRLNGRTLEYLVWPAADSAPDALPTVYPMLEDLAQLNFRALDEFGSWASAWPGDRRVGVLPRALEAQFVLADGQRVSRLFVLR